MPDFSLRSDIEDTFKQLRTQFGMPDDPEPDDGSLLPDDPVLDDPVPAAPLDVPEHVDEPDLEPDLYFPGSTRRIEDEPPAVEPEVPAERDWREITFTEIVDGREVEFYPIRALALALKRSPITLRKWETKGWLPGAPYRSSSSRSDRLYTLKHVEGLVAIAQEEGLLGPLKKPRLDQTRFPARAQRLFTALAARRLP
jgi:hypothetical protein